MDYARRLVIEDPYREPDRLHLMSLYAASGNPAAGLRLCAEWERLLREELGETPSRAMQEMKAKLSAAAPGAGRPARPQPDTSGPLKRGAAAAPPGRRPGPRPISLGRVPLRFTRFFGRGEEIAALTGLLADPEVRLVTLTGLGGIGKTRLAIETVAPLKERVAGGVWFASLTDLRDPSAISGAVRDALRLPRLPGLDPLEQVSAALAEHQAVLVLDNFEHLLDGGTAAVAALLSRVPMLTCLVTSRRRLDVPGETVFPVSALPLPPSVKPGMTSTVTPGSLTDLSAIAGVQLFIDRARFVRPDFQLTPRKAADLVRLLRTLEGIPLAIELAAAQAKALTLTDMAERLTARFDLLAVSRPLIEARHLSLRVTLEWSYDLLPPPLQRFFASLSVFRGGWDREAAQAVCGEALGGALSVPGAIGELTSFSLLTSDDGGESTHSGDEGSNAARSRMLETVREFAEGRLTAAELAALRRRHAAYFLAWAEAAEPQAARPRAARLARPPGGRARQPAGGSGLGRRTARTRRDGAAAGRGGVLVLAPAQPPERGPRPAGSPARPARGQGRTASGPTRSRESGSSPITSTTSRRPVPGWGKEWLSGGRSATRAAPPTGWSTPARPPSRKATTWRPARCSRRAWRSPARQATRGCWAWRSGWRRPGTAPKATTRRRSPC